MSRTVKVLVTIAGVCLLAGVAFVGCFSTVKPKVELDGKAVEAMTTFDYQDWSEVVTTHVDDKGRVNYAALLQNRAPLDRFVALIAEVGPKTRPPLFPDRASKLTYYINAYNALTMFNVINRMPEFKSVHEDEKDFFYFTEFELDGDEISLYKLENDVVRPFGEPRIHFALNCASASCPELPNEAFLPAQLEAQLKRETDKFLNEKRNVTVEEGQIVLSSIFKWYAEDFAPNPVDWVRKNAPDLDLPAEMKVKHRDYDWSLNAQK